MTDLRKAAEPVAYTGNGTAGREADVQPTGFFFQMPKREWLEWTPCIKLPVVVHVRKQREGETHISTREGITPVLPDDLIMRGVAGEEYPIGRDLFERTYTFDVDAVNTSQERVDETAKGEQEPVAVWELEEDGWNTIADPDWMETLPVGTRLYTAPPKREWVWLTDEEIKEIVGPWGYTPVKGYTRKLFDQIEAKLKEKNT